MSDPPSPMDPSSGTEGEATELQRTYAQLLQLHEEIRSRLVGLLKQAEAPAIREVVREAVRTGEPSAERAAERLAELSRNVEAALRVAHASQEELKRDLADADGGIDLESLANLPARLTRFIAERRDNPGFHYEVARDPARGWTVRWKEYGSDGLIAGSGQFCERPYRWPDETET